MDVLYFRHGGFCLKQNPERANHKMFFTLFITTPYFFLTDANPVSHTSLADTIFVPEATPIPGTHKITGIIQVGISIGNA